MFYFRVDANETVATGHVMRCITIAKCIERLGEECTFITADHNADRLIVPNGFRTICLESKWDELDLEIEKFLKLVKIERVEKLLVDSYYATKTYIAELNKYCHVYLMDDIGDQDYDVYSLINYNIFADKLSYPIRYRDRNTKLLLGIEYAPLRMEYTYIGTHLIRDEVRDILITTGGADEFNVAYGLLSKIKEKQLFKKMMFHVICGSMNRNTNKLLEIEKQWSQVKLYQNFEHMSELMRSCDIGVSAGGITMYELCACGLPSICICTADNQRKATESFAEREIMLYAGDVREDNDGLDKCIVKICSYLSLLEDNPLLRVKISSKMKRLIDGNGAMRLANKMLCTSTNH